MAWTTPKTWTAATLTSSDMNLHVRDNMDYLKAHEAASSAQHGLPASVHVLGNRAAAGEFVQRGSYTCPLETGSGAEYTLTVTFPAAFSSAPFVLTDIRRSGDHSHTDQPYSWTVSASAVSCKIWVTNGHTVTLSVIAIGT